MIKEKKEREKKGPLYKERGGSIIKEEENEINGIEELGRREIMNDGKTLRKYDRRRNPMKVRAKKRQSKRGKENGRYESKKWKVLNKKNQ